MGNKIVLILISLLAGFAAHTQSRQMRVHADQKIYIAGEKIWLAGIKPGATGSAELVSAYLVDRGGNIVQKGRIMDEAGKFSLSLQLDGKLASDHYLLAISSKGYKDVFFPVTLINPVIPPMSANGNLDLAPVDAPTEQGININKKEFRKREEVVLEAASKTDAEVHISVSRRDDLSRYIDSALNGWKDPGLAIAGSQTGEGEQISVTVYNGSNEPAVGVRVFASVLGDQANIATAITDKQGRAAMALPYVYGNASLVFSVPEGSYRIVYEEPTVQVRGEILLPPLQLEERFRESVNQRLINAEVTNKYRPETKTGYITAALDTTDFYGLPDRRYMLDDYTRIPNMEEILYEYVQEARARKVGERSVIYVFNTPFKTFFDLPAMVLLDGIPVADINQLLAMDPLTLRSVEVIPKKFLLDDLQIPGILHYKSYRSDMAGFKLPAGDIVQTIQGLSIPIKPLFASGITSAAERLPDMRNLAYWSAFSEQRQWKFFTPDSEGEYLVTLWAVDREGNESRSQRVIIVK